MGAFTVASMFAVGYLLCMISPDMRCKIVRMEGYRLYFYVGVYGAALLFASTVIVSFLDLFNIPSLYIVNFLMKIESLKDANGITDLESKVLVVSMSSVCLALFTSYSKKIYFHLFPKKLDAIRLSMAKNNALEHFLLDSQVRMAPVSITLSSDKVYVGFVGELDPANGHLEHITILPTLSGYRDDKKQLMFTTNYYTHYAQSTDSWAEGVYSKTNFSKFRIILPSSEIVSISKFDLDTYIKINSNIALKS